MYKILLIAFSVTVISIVYLSLTVKITVPQKRTIYVNEPITIVQYIRKLASSFDTNTENKIALVDGGRYFKDTNSNIYFYDFGNSMLNTPDYFYKIDGADPDTFTEINCGTKNTIRPLINCHPGFAKDKYYVYKNGLPLKNVDPGTFKFQCVHDCVPNEPCFSDKINTYYMTDDQDFIPR